MAEVNRGSLSSSNVHPTEGDGGWSDVNLKCVGYGVFSHKNNLI